jgi:FkbM family methyltransferase
MWAGAYEPKLVTLLKTTLKPGMTFLDLGANIGYFSVIAARLVGDQGHVHAFEPMHESFVRLQRNLQPFHWASPHECAVGNVTGDVPITYSMEESGWATIHEQHRPGSQSSVVNVIRLDDWLKANPLDRVDFMKLDIEGSVVDALLGARELIGRFLPSLIAETKEGWHYDEICEMLIPKGYKCRSFQDDCILARSPASPPF